MRHLPKGAVLFDATPWTQTKKGAPDGMKTDKNGNLFAAGPGGIHVFAPDGTHLGSFEISVPTANCAWGNDGDILSITSNTAIYRVHLRTKVKDSNTLSPQAAVQSSPFKTFRVKRLPPKAIF